MAAKKGKERQAWTDSNAPALPLENSAAPQAADNSSGCRHPQDRYSQ